MARFIVDRSGDRPAPTGPTAGTATPPARNRLLGDRRRAQAVPGVVVLGGDVHSHYVADLKADFDDPTARRSSRREFCGSSITSLSLRAGARRRGARLQPALPLRAQRPARLHALRAATRSSCRRSCASSTALDPASGVTTAARFVVGAAAGAVGGTTRRPVSRPASTSRSTVPATSCPWRPS